MEKNKTELPPADKAGREMDKALKEASEYADSLMTFIINTVRPQAPKDGTK